MPPTTISQGASLQLPMAQDSNSSLVVNGPTSVGNRITKRKIDDGSAVANSGESKGLNAGNAREGTVEKVCPSGDAKRCAYPMSLKRPFSFLKQARRKATCMMTHSESSRRRTLFQLRAEAAFGADGPLIG